MLSFLENFLWVDKFIWSGLVALGVQFLYMGYRLRSERVFAYFGASLLLLALVFMGQVSPIPYFASLGGKVAWAYFSILMILAFLPVYLQFVFEVTGFLKPWSFRVFCLACAGLAAFMIWDFFSGHEWIVTPFNARIAVPIQPEYLIGSFFVYVLFESFRVGKSFLTKSMHSDNRRFLWFIFGTFTASLAVVGDPLGFSMDLPGHTWGEYSIKGAGIFAVSGVYYLIHRLLTLHRLNQKTLKELAVAYVELNQSMKMKALGISAASISHEIRNYAAALKGNAYLMGSDLSMNEHREEMKRIHATAESMETIAKDIALYTRNSYPVSKVSVPPERLLYRCISNWFGLYQERFHIDPFPSNVGIFGNENDLERIFINFFKNSFEAGAKTINVRPRVFNRRLIIVIEDDGRGCEIDELEQITKPFYTSKSQGGTGLGCSIADFTLKFHGASSRYYAKNVLNKSQSGMVLVLVFPIIDTSGVSPSPIEIKVICSENKIPDALIKPVNNLGINPLVIHSGSLTNSPGTDAWGPPTFIDEKLKHEFSTINMNSRIIAVKWDRTAHCLESLGNEEDYPYLFTEEQLAIILERWNGS